MDKARKKQRKRYLLWALAAVVVLLLAVMPMLASNSGEADSYVASILSAQAESRDVDSQVIGGGQLSGEAAVAVEIPENVKLTGFLVGNGDTVAQGDPIAQVDKISVMTAITQVQETLDYLAEEIADADGEEESDTVKALAGGTVKAIYAQEGEQVLDVMLRDGALAVLSLDGLMAVQVERSTDLAVGETVCVSLPEDTEVDGTVVSNLDGVLTVTIEDDDYAVGDKVTLTTEDGGRIGSGTLYIYSPWNAVAYSGTVSKIQVSEGATVTSGRTLMQLTDTGRTAQYQQLIDQRQEYEELMQQLFRLYRTGILEAPADGIVSGIDENGTFLLADTGSGWLTSLLTAFTGREEGFLGIAARVEEVTDDGLVLTREKSLSTIADLSDLSAFGSAQLTESWTYTGDTTLYTHTADGILQAAGTAQPGDLLVAVGDEENIYWLVAIQETEARNTAQVSLLSQVAESPEETPEPPAAEEPPMEEEPVAPEETVSAVRYDGYLAQVVEVEKGTMKVLQTPYSYTVTDLEKLPEVTVDTDAMTEEERYTDERIDPEEIAVGDILMLVLDEEGNLIHFDEPNEKPGGQMPGGDTDQDQTTGTMPSGGGSSSGMSGFGGSTTVEEVFEVYSLGTLTVASVTSQANMTVEITVDEMDITLLYPGQEAVVTVDALAGLQFPATITSIGSSGTNSGGTSKFTVELTLEKSGDMLPGMRACAYITVDTTENALCIPVAALVEEGTKVQVYTAYDEKNAALGSPVTVTVGSSDGEYVQILEGLEEGQTVYYAYYDTLVISNTIDSAGFSFRFGK